MSFEYKVRFAFTTFDLRRSMATGRNGSMSIYTALSIDELDKEEVKLLCVNEVVRLKPKWNILMLDIESITLAKSKQNPQTK
jgi:hypothetical protein